MLDGLDSEEEDRLFALRAEEEKVKREAQEIARAQEQDARTVQAAAAAKAAAEKAADEAAAAEARAATQDQAAARARGALEQIRGRLVAAERDLAAKDREEAKFNEQLIEIGANWNTEPSAEFLEGRELPTKIKGLCWNSGRNTTWKTASIWN